MRRKSVQLCTIPHYESGKDVLSYSKLVMLGAVTG